MNKDQVKNLLVVVFAALGFLGLSSIEINQAKPPEETTEKPLMAAKAIFNACKPDGDENCYAKEFTPLAEEQGPDFAFEALFILQQRDSNAIGCHLIAHGIGLGTYLHDPSNWQQSIQNINPACSYGAIHGVLENYVQTLPGGKLPKEMVPSICGDSPRADCNHIVGHLILVEVEANVEEGLNICDVFKNVPTQLEYCYTGIFMEYQTAFNLIDHGLATESWLDWPARVDGLVAMCRTYSETKAITCWKEIVHAAAVKYHNNAEEVFVLCDSAPIAKASYECKMHSIGILAANFKFDYAYSRSICEAKQADPSFAGGCYNMLVASTLSTINTPQTQEATSQFCSSLGKVYQSPCLNQLNYFKQVTPSFYMESN